MSSQGPKGDTGEQGPRGEQGKQGKQGESKLAQAAEEQVERLIKAKSTPKWWGRAFLVMALVLAIVVGYLGWKDYTHPLSNQLKAELASQQAQQKSLEQYVQQYAQHGCQALDLLTSVPVPKPADPAANPSRETTYEFYLALLYWEHADGCSVTAHHVAAG
jgi:hypothetical protein